MGVRSFVFFVVNRSADGIARLVGTVHDRDPKAVYEAAARVRPATLTGEEELDLAIGSMVDGFLCTHCRLVFHSSHLLIGKE